MMKIGIDISQIIYQGTGVGRFTQGLTEAILNYDKKNHWLFFFSSFDRSAIKRDAFNSDSRLDAIMSS